MPLEGDKGRGIRAVRPDWEIDRHLPFSGVIGECRGSRRGNPIDLGFRQQRASSGEAQSLRSK